MSQRELFTSVYIRATISNHSLLKDNEIAIVGYITDKKRYTRTGYCMVPIEVCFHYGTEYPDFFYFENMQLVYQAISIKTPEYLTDIYSECVMSKPITPEELIEKVLDAYVFKELGF